MDIRASRAVFPGMFSPTIVAAATALLDAARDRKLRIATAESCTGGLIAGALTAIAGSSLVVDRGFVTYSNGAKTDVLAVPADLIREHGAVSREVAIAMAEGALRASPADIVVAVTGVAGPGGGTDAKPVGLVHLAAARRGRAPVHLEKRFGDIGRDKVREETVLTALLLMQSVVD